MNISGYSIVGASGGEPSRVETTKPLKPKKKRKKVVKKKSVKSKKRKVKRKKK